MSEISVKEAYRVLQANCGIEVGDKVKILRIATERDRSYGWTGITGASNSVVGMEKIVDEDKGARGFGLKNYSKDYPFPCLELVQKAKPKPPPIVLGGHEVEFLDGKIKVCDVTVSKETLQEMVRRLEN